MADENGFPPMAPPHPKIAWQLKKTLETIAFVTEASVAYFTRTDFRGDERERLREEIERLVRGDETLIVVMSVDEWMTKMRTPKQMRTFGALPPSGMEWQTGKTVATLDFVREAENALATQAGLEPDEKYKLEAKIERLKDGSESLEDDETVEGWLERLRDHYP